jgi:UDP-N-acetylmuramyl tripeptide synthase
MLRYLPAILVGRLARVIIRIFRKGGGSALPGLILSKIAPGILFKTLDSFKQGLVVVTGSAGKSTTTKMLVAIARAHGMTVFTNPSTANILQGFYSTIIEKSASNGVIRADIAILEMDEGHARALTEKVQPRQVTILNVMEDQLDRFVDPALVRADLTEVAKRARDAVVLNADDQNTVIIGEEVDSGHKYWFGLSGGVLRNAKSGLATAPTYLEPLARPKVDAEVVDSSGTDIVISRHGRSFGVALPNRGVHFALDAVAAFQSAAVLLGEKFDPQLAASTISELPPVFARGELVEVFGKPAEFNLVQNPGSMQLNLDALAGEPDQILFAIGRDVHDPSWLWTVDYSNLKHVSVVTGFNAAEAALVLEYHGVTYDRLIPDLEQAIDYFFNLDKPTRGIKTVLFSADAMRRMRRALGFWSPEEVSR